MTDEIIRLTAADFEECVTFLQYAFGDKQRFDEVLPSIYRPTDEAMQCNLAIRREGKIAAVVGVFPITQHFGERSLRLAGIGGVGVDPKYRGEGLMRILMDRALEQILEDGYQLSYLGGQRQRYRYWGWERCGAQLEMDITPANIRHEPVDAGVSDITLRPFTDEVAQLKAMYDARAMHCERSAERFERYLHWHQSDIHVAVDGAGQVVGYAVVYPEYDRICVVGFHDHRVGMHILRLVVEQYKKLFKFYVSCPHSSPFVEALGQSVEELRINHACNWQIFDWPGTVEALLDHHAKHRLLQEGSVIIGIEEADQSLRLTVDGQAGMCKWTDDPPLLTTDRHTMMRVLFGPTPPALVTTIPQAAAILNAWCPLPLGLPNLDWV